jgi:hypothetical protein
MASHRGLAYKIDPSHGQKIEDLSKSTKMVRRIYVSIGEVRKKKI